MDLACHDRVARLCFGVVALRLARVREHVLCDSRCLDDGIVGREIAREDCDAAFLAVRFLDAVNDRAVEYARILDAAF